MEKKIVHNRRVLVVDDEPALQDIMKLLLEGEGFDVVVAGNGEAALKIFQETNPELVISDLRIPGMDGAVLCRTIKRMSPSTKVIIFSAMPYDNGYFDAVEKNNQPDAYLSKPASGGAILSAVKKALKLK